MGYSLARILNLAIFFLLTRRTRIFDLNFVSAFFFILIRPTVVNMFSILVRQILQVLKDIYIYIYIWSVTGLKLILCDETDFTVWIC